jgi:peptide deformylase
VAFLPIYLFGQPVLRRKARPVKSADPVLVQLAADMFETMHHANGIGLAANQVGSLQRIIVVDVSGMEGPEEQAPPPLALINPVIVSEEGSWAMEEGCLSIPGVRDEVERAELITVRYRDLEFNEQRLEADGLLARVILHEIDHLDGVLFFDHVSAVKRKLLRGRLNKIAKGEIEVDYPVISIVPETEQGVPATARV